MNRPPGRPLLLLPFLPVPLLPRVGVLLCRLGWHPPPFRLTGFDGVDLWAVCSRCGHYGRIDDADGSLL